MPTMLKICCAMLMLVGASLAQADRYELGLRLRAFERHLDAEKDASRRAAAMVELNSAVQAFFSLDMHAVAKAIAAADAALAGKKPSVAEQFAVSLQWSLRQRLVETGMGTLLGKISAAYPVGEEGVEPEGFTVRIEVPASARGGEGQSIDVPLVELPQATELTLAGMVAGDHVLRWSVRKGDTVLAQREQALSVVTRLGARLKLLRDAAQRAKLQKARTIEAKTLIALEKLLQVMCRRRANETVLRGSELLAEAEALAAWLAKPTEQPFYGAHRPGSFHLRVPAGERTIAVRLHVPKGAAKRPLVVALHGAGGSENMFFDGYGDGRVVSLAAKRDWFVVAPRVGLGRIDVAPLVAALAERFPIDTGKVVVVGHSMGAMQAVANATRFPERYRAVAALGGGGRVGRGKGLEKLPFFVGVGAKDFARSGAMALHAALQQADAPSEFREYTDVEHLAIVQLALDDVFAFFDSALDRKSVV